MKKVTKFFMVALLAGMCSFGYAQQFEWQKPVKPSETCKGTIAKKYFAGSISYDKNGRILIDTRKTFTIEQLYSMLEKDAKIQYGNNIVLRQFKYNQDDRDKVSYQNTMDTYDRAYFVSASVVTNVDPLNLVLQKALQNIQPGSRMAIDQIRVVNSGDRESFKDKVIEVLLDQGYRVVAKESLEKLYQEQQSQQSGLFNERTTVQENNFSAIGYFVNVKRTESSIKVQIINVSTGEYEANTSMDL